MSFDFSNADRAESVIDALAVFVDRMNMEGEPHETQLGDLLTNLLHYADHLGLDPFEVARKSVGMFASELVCPNDLGPDLFAELKIDGESPREAVARAKRLMNETLHLN